MLTSKLILAICTWGMAFLVSISFRTAGIIHPQPFYINLVISVIYAAAFLYYSRKTE